MTFIIAVCCGASPYSVAGQGGGGVDQANANGGAGAGGGGHAPVHHTILATGYLSTLAFGYIQPMAPEFSSMSSSGGNGSNHGSGGWKLKLLNVARSWRNIDICFTCPKSINPMVPSSNTNIFPGWGSCNVIIRFTIA